MLKKIISFFEDKPKEQKRVRKSFALVEEVKTAEQGDQEITKEDIRRGKELFWGRYPHYPEMSTVYRKLFQKFEIDNSKRVKVYDSLCGSDMCNIASGSGPMVDYICDDDHAPLVLQQVKNLGLSDKIDRLVNYEKDNIYFAHVFSFYPKLDHEDAIDWQRLDDCTAPAGYVFLPKLVTNPKDLKKKPSQKLADNIAFYFYIELDHTMHWISVLNRKIEILQKETPPGFETANQNVIKIFRDEVSKWASLLKQLKSNEISIVTSVYKHDDE